MKLEQKLFNRFQKELSKDHQALQALDELGINQNLENEIGFCPSNYDNVVPKNQLGKYELLNIKSLVGCIIFPLTDDYDDINGFAGFDINSKEWIYPSKGIFRLQGKGKDLFIVPTPVDALILNFTDNVNTASLHEAQDDLLKNYSKIYHIGFTNKQDDWVALDIPSDDFKSYFIDQGNRIDDLMGQLKNDTDKLISEGTKHSIDFHTTKYIIQELDQSDLTECRCKIKVIDSKNHTKTFSNIFNLESSKNRITFANEASDQLLVGKNTLVRELQVILNLLDEARSQRLVKSQPHNSSEVSVFEKQQAIKSLTENDPLDYLDKLMDGYATEDMALGFWTLLSNISTNPLLISFKSSNNLDWKEFTQWLKAITPNSLASNLKYIQGKINRSLVTIGLKEHSPIQYCGTIVALKQKHLKVSKTSKLKAILSVVEPVEVVNDFLDEHYSESLSNQPHTLVQLYIELINSITLLYQFKRDHEHLPIDDMTIPFIKVEASDILKANELFKKILDTYSPQISFKAQSILGLIHSMQKDNSSQESFTKRELIEHSNEKESRIRHGLDELELLGHLNSTGTKGQTKTYQIPKSEIKPNQFPLIQPCNLATLQPCEMELVS